jgi:hypothetical protein
MKAIRLFSALFSTLLICIVASASAHAGARDRVFVASYGSDSNPCTFGSPCKTFQNAVNVVAAGGEVTAIDSAGFGPINITKSVTITSPNGVEAGIAAAANADAIDINAGNTDKVSLQGLTLDGTNIGNNGIVFSSGGALEVVNCTVRSFLSDGLSVVSNALLEFPQSLTVSNSRFVDNWEGIYIEVDSVGAVSADFDRTSLSGNANLGLYAYGLNGIGAITIGMTDSVASHNGDGIYVLSGADGANINISVTHSLFVRNGIGFTAEGTNTSIWLAQSTLAGNETSFFAGNGGEVVTYGDNYVSGDNGPPSGVFTTGTKQ